MVPFQAEKDKNSSTKCNISEEDKKSSTKIVPFQKRVKNLRQKMYHFRKGSKLLSKNGTITQQKWYNFRRGSNIVNKNGTISEKGRKSSTKMVPF